MGTLELLPNHVLLLRAHIITYGAAADEILTAYIRSEIETMWNEPQAKVLFALKPTRLQFSITATYNPQLSPEEIFNNTDPANNYFRIEEFVNGNISFVDALGSNTGFFKKENLYIGSTTAAHEFGHTLGLPHPTDLDLRGKGVPGIMYPRGTIVDPEYQYDPTAAAGAPGGTMHPMYRKVTPEDVGSLQINKLRNEEHKDWVMGDFSNVWHDDHQKFA
ncbi:peptidase M10 [Taibaiella sp. KBW10]|uniref:peptidase M10 n=1 Tax=Taibaiella sp. KBW10 TaxID=2153357 RepID=UPI000F5A2E20|nr:peptidase M10 [Taibaiella sp. KBW10]RQO30254.1 peptidase M10 [Taibaiella sp. KBW10]